MERHLRKSDDKKELENGCKLKNSIYTINYYEIAKEISEFTNFQAKYLASFNSINSIRNGFTQEGTQKGLRDIGRTASQRKEIVKLTNSQASYIAALSSIDSIRNKHIKEGFTRVHDKPKR